MDNDYLTTDDVATMLRTSPETVRYWRNAGKGPKSFKVGRRVLYARADVERLVADARGGNEADENTPTPVTSLPCPHCGGSLAIVGAGR